MDKKNIIQKLFEKPEIKDYTYSILFFFISSFFAFFAIRPALTIAFSLRRESFDLKRTNQIYENQILKLIEIQSNFETVRSKIYLLEEAIPMKPDVNRIVSDINQNAVEEKVAIRNVNIAGIPLKTTSRVNNMKLKPVSVSIEAEGNYLQISDFIKKTISKRRLKTIKTLTIVKKRSAVDSSSIASQSSNLNLKMTIEGYYL